MNNCLGRPSLKLIESKTTWYSVSGEDLNITEEVKLEVTIEDKTMTCMFVVVKYSLHSST